MLTDEDVIPYEFLCVTRSSDRKQRPLQQHLAREAASVVEE